MFNDLNKYLSLENCIMYADDINIFLKGSCYETLYEVVNEELLNTNNWLRANRLFLNTDKILISLLRYTETL